MLLHQHMSTYHSLLSTFLTTLFSSRLPGVDFSCLIYYFNELVTWQWLLRTWKQYQKWVIDKKLFERSSTARDNFTENSISVGMINSVLAWAPVRPRWRRWSGTGWCSSDLWHLLPVTSDLANNNNSYDTVLVSNWTHSQPTYLIFQI